MTLVVVWRFCIEEIVKFGCHQAVCSKGRKNLHDMVNKNLPTLFWKKIKPYISNYRINLVEAKKVDDFKKIKQIYK